MATQIDVAFPGGSLARARPLDAYRTTVRRGGRTASSKIGSCPRVVFQVADFGIEHLLLLARASKARG